MVLVKKRLKPSVDLNGKPMTELQSITCHMDHSVTCHPAQENALRLNLSQPGRDGGTRLTNRGQMEGWVDLGSPIAAWPGIKPTTAWSDALTITPQSHRSVEDVKKLCILFAREITFLASAMTSRWLDVSGWIALRRDIQNCLWQLRRKNQCREL